MSTLLANRVHSAHPRSSSKDHASTIQQRPTSSVTAHRSPPDIFALTDWGRPPASTASIRGDTYQQPKTVGISTSTTGQVPVAPLQADEIDSLLESINRDDEFVVQVDCLADYRKLVETVNLRRTPVDWKSLYALQKRENRIIQRNACRDRRLHSLLQTLGPRDITQKNDNQTKEKKYKYFIES